MASGGLVVVTGFKELNAKLRTLEPKLQRKFVNGALRKGGKRLTQEAVRIIEAEAYDTGTLAKSVKVKALKRRKGRVGVSVMPPRDVLLSKYAKAQQKLRKKSGNATFAKPKTYYYPASVEFGTESQQPVKPFRRALYENAGVYRTYFAADLKQFVDTGAVDYKLTS